MCLYSARPIQPALQVSSISCYGTLPAKPPVIHSPRLPYLPKRENFLQGHFPFNIESYEFSSSEGRLQESGTAAALIPRCLSSFNPISKVNHQVQRPQLTQPNKMAPKANLKELT